MAKRFASNSTEDIQRKRNCLTPANTSYSNSRASVLFKEYLKETDEDVEFELFTEEKLNSTLATFYINARKKDGGQYKLASLENLRHSLNRHLQAPPFNRQTNIISGEAFTSANMSFKTALMELKAAGLGDTNHHPIITDDDRRKLYTSNVLSTSTPTGLQNKVQFDIRLYFMRRGSENMHSMTKDTFEIKTDHSRRYVSKKRDELSKNHRESDREKVTGVMPATDDEFCPVASFEKYVSKLNAKCNKLWQRPLDSFLDDSDVWYCNSPIGVNILAKFMTRISTRCELSQIYTNHSIRATGATLLTRENFSSSQIMSVSGHRSVSSLAVYQRTSHQEQMNMGDSLGDQLRSKPNEIHRPRPSATVTSQQVVHDVTAPPPPAPLPVVVINDVPVPVPVINDLAVVNNDLDEVLIEQLFTDFDQNADDTDNNTRTNIPVHVFNNCKVNIQTVNIVMKK